MKSLPLLPLALACSLAAPGALLALPPVDSAPVDAREILNSLKTLRDQQTAQAKANKQRMLGESAAAASNPARAAELWEDAVRATQFQGAARESAQFREWKDKEGDALKDKEVASALHLYFQWLNLTLQRASGTEAKALLPQVFQHTRELAADQAGMDALEDQIRREKEQQARDKAEHRPMTAHDKEKRRDLEATKRMHDAVLGKSLATSPFVQWARIGEAVAEIAPPRRRGGGGNRGGDTGGEEGATGWEGTPGNLEGIYQTILLPEFRAAKDLRVLEYWDNKLRQETEAASRTKVAFELEKLNTIRRPQLLWSRAQDVAKMGFKNRAATDMFSLIKTYPAHPDAKSWMDELEAMLAPAPATPSAAVNSPTAVAPPATPPAP